MRLLALLLWFCQLPLGPLLWVYSFFFGFGAFFLALGRGVAPANSAGMLGVAGVRSELLDWVSRHREDAQCGPSGLLRVVEPCVGASRCVDRAAMPMNVLDDVGGPGTRSPIRRSFGLHAPAQQRLSASMGSWPWCVCLRYAHSCLLTGGGGAECCRVEVTFDP